MTCSRITDNPLCGIRSVEKALSGFSDRISANAEVGTANALPSRPACAQSRCAASHLSGQRYFWGGKPAPKMYLKARCAGETYFFDKLCNPLCGIFLPYCRKA